MDANPNQHGDAGDEPPQRQNEGPIEQAAETGSAFTAALALFGLPGRGAVAPAVGTVRARFGWPAAPVLGPRAQFEALGFAAPLASLPPRHSPSPARKRTDST